MIEEELKKLEFQGASGWIEFNQNQAVSTPIEVFWILENGSYKRVGIYNPLNSSGFHVNINSSDIPSDTVPRVYEYILIPLPVAIDILTGHCLTTIQSFL